MLLVDARKVRTTVRGLGIGQHDRTRVASACDADGAEGRYLTSTATRIIDALVEWVAAKPIAGLLLPHLIRRAVPTATEVLPWPVVLPLAAVAAHDGIPIARFQRIANTHAPASARSKQLLWRTPRLSARMIRPRRTT